MELLSRGGGGVRGGRGVVYIYTDLRIFYQIRYTQSAIIGSNRERE